MLGFSLQPLRWILHFLTDELKVTRVATSMKMLEILEQQEWTYFVRIITGDESWFFLQYSRNHVWRLSNENSPEPISQQNGQGKPHAYNLLIRNKTIG
jgi:hypothetical protein